MDFLDNSKLTSTSNLAKVLEGLCCSEDSNAKDSIYNKSTTVDNEDCYGNKNHIFGESFECENKMIQLGLVDLDDKESVWDLGWNDSDAKRSDNFIFAKIACRWNL